MTVGDLYLEIGCSLSKLATPQMKEWFEIVNRKDEFDSLMLTLDHPNYVAVVVVTCVTHLFINACKSYCGFRGGER